MTTSVTEEPTIDAASRTSAVAGNESSLAGSESPVAGTESLPPRGTDPSLPPDANPEPLPIGIGDMWRLAQKTYRAERRYYLKLERHRPMIGQAPGGLDLPERSSGPSSSSAPPARGRPSWATASAASRRSPTITSHRPPRPPGATSTSGLWGYRRSRWFFRLVYSWLVRVERDGDLRFSEKTPTNIFLIPFLSRAFPDAQFIHIIRDGRDAASSHMHKPWLRAEDAWSGEREPGGYLHGPWPKFWVEPERREEFLRTSDARRMAWAWRRYTETGLARRLPAGRKAIPRAALRVAGARARWTRASASSTSWASRHRPRATAS